MADNQQIDHYDFINAPQFVDFDDLASHEDPHADKFFETHREEDDFAIPLDFNNISPTVQLLYGDDDDNEHYSNEANKAAMAAGLEDVKIEYYASPQSQQQKTSTESPHSSAKKDKRSVTSTSSIYGTPMGISGASSGASFYTPTGYEDKENLTPSNRGSAKSALKTGSAKKSDGKTELNLTKDISSSNSPRSILVERIVEDKKSPYLSPYNKKLIGSTEATESLYAKLEGLEIVSSDEDDFWNDSRKENDDSQSQSYEESKTNNNVASPFTGNKRVFLGLDASPKEEDEDEIRNDNTSSNHNDETLVVQQTSIEEPQTVHDQGLGISPIRQVDSDEEENNEQNKSAPMELRTPIRNILSKLDAELQLEEDNQNNFDDPRYSIVVAPSVGQQIHWNAEDEGETNGRYGILSGRPLNISYQVNEDVHNAHAYAPYSYESEGEELIFSGDLYAVPVAASSHHCASIRRSSSVGDLTRALLMEPKSRDFKTYGYNPRLGITIPKTPESARSPMVQKESCPGPSKMDAFSSNKNSCYFEIDAPAPVKDMRRVSSCSDLVKLHEIRKPTSIRKPIQKKPLTIPRTPDTVKRSRMGNASNPSSVSSMCNDASIRNQVGAKKTGPSVTDRLAAARSRQPMKGNHYVSMAEQMAKYQKNTPDRFRSLPRGHVPEKRSTSCDTHKRGGSSPAHSPTGSTRSRADSFSSSKGEVRNARAVNNGPILPKRVELKPTIPVPFNFGQTHKRPVVVKEDTVDFKFKARPVPVKSNETFLKSRPQVKVTQPMSPRFASDARLRERQQKKSQAVTKAPEPKQVKPSNVPKSSRIPTSTPSLSRTNVEEHKTTVAQPFSSSFEARQNDCLRRKNKEELIKHKLEEEKKKKEFHANPVPKYSAAKLPKKKPVEATHVEPFRFHSEMRGAAYQEAFKRRVEEEEQYLREQAQFHAQPADVVHKAPFEPEKPARHIEVLDFHLATERRAVEREQFDEQIREREREEEERRQKEQEELEELQRKEDIEKRRQLVHKAQPFKPPKPFQLKSSGRALTVPQSPAFSALPSQRRIGIRQPSPAPE